MDLQINHSSNLKIALVYDRINKWGGAERVLLALHKLFPEAPIYTSVYNSKTAMWAEGIKILPSILQKIPFARKQHEQFALFMPMVFENFSFDDYDLVISVTSEAAKGILTSPKTMHISMILTPTRYLWSGYKEYFGNPVFAAISNPFVSYLRAWDLIAARRPDYLIAISENVQRRIEKYYKRGSDVIYPPVTLFPSKSIPNKKKEYFLVVARLSRFTPYKRVDLAIKAANRAKIPLKIIGEIHDEYFTNMAGPTIEFLGKVSDERLSDIYAGAKALIFPGSEDFGLVMVEAQAHGVPVIAYRDGGALEIVQEGKTGEFFDRQTVTSLSEKLENFSQKRYNSKTCLENAKRFSTDEFEKNLATYLSAKVKEYRNGF